MNLLRCKPAEHVFIAIPSYFATLQFDTTLSILSSIQSLKAAGIEVSFKCVEGNCYVDLARNELVGAFLASDATDLVFVDADVGYEDDTLLKIVRANRPVVAAIYPKKTDDESYPVDFLPGFHPMDSDGMIEVGMAPTGLLRINRVVFDALKPKVKSFRGRKGEQLGAYFETDIREAYYGEDIEFCRIWREIGGKIWVFPNETLSHTGPRAWMGNLGSAMKGGKLK